MINRQWLLAKRPVGAVTPDCFRYNEVPSQASPPADGMVLLRHELLLCAPTIRNWISGNRDSYYPTVEIDAPIMAPAIGRIVVSNDPDWPVGTRLVGAGSWQDEQWVDPVKQGFRKVPEHISSVDAMGVVGINALTAYCGLLRVGQVREGEVLLVSGAAGSVGSVVAQIGRIKGCRVIGICGGADKVRWLSEECGIDHVIDYKGEDVVARLDELCPDGIDVFFDNVGGSLLRDVVARMKPKGRIVLCGQISAYEGTGEVATPPLDVMRMIYGGIRMEGFLARHHVAAFDEAINDLAQWDAEGLLTHREDVRDGFARLPET